MPISTDKTHGDCLVCPPSGYIIPLSDARKGHSVKSHRLLAGAAALTLVAPLAAIPAHAAPAAADRFTQTTLGRIDSTLKPAFLNKDRLVKVIVELTDDPVAVAEAKAVEASGEQGLSENDKTALRGRLADRQKPVAERVRGKGGRVLAQMQDAYNGVKAQVKLSELEALAATPGVKAIHAAPVHRIENSTSVPYLGAPQVWQSTGYTGKGIKVAIIDTGVDYTHADFAGPGTVAAYEQAKANGTQPADPKLFGPDAPRVKGGWDFVGDAYDAEDPASVPAPDPNPLDCQGHGSHVAGTAAGGGVTADGASYAGPYDASTAGRDWRVGPGVAPQADIYALRVFGCEGSTDVTTEAIDWAVRNGVDVINMSLGSTYGLVDDPSAVAATNAVGAGVVVIASAGNSGPNPYLTGTPGGGRGVVSVAANDSTASFPGATVSLPGGASITAIVANGVSPLPAGPFTVVALKDDPATPENEALGCSIGAYTSNGVRVGANQLAVSVRGTCARVAKAVFAQQAGAAAAAMVDTSSNYPPYEGEILANPDTGEQYRVTIPFLGVRGVLGAAPTDDGDQLVAAAGGQVRLAATNLENPGFGQFASFSSGGPRNGDSGLKPGVTAPGVSTRSAAVGTGNGMAISSGTSMAAPHVAGVAALTVQAHPRWSAPAIAASLVNTADPEKIGNQRITLGGTGLVDLAGAIAASVTVTGDSYVTDSGRFAEPSLSFGFAESTGTHSATKRVTVTNHGSKPVTYRVSIAPSAQSAQASVSANVRTIRVPARGKATFRVSMSVRMDKIPGSLGDDQFAFHEVSGYVVLSGPDTLRVPYLLVPRAQADVAASANFAWSPRPGAATVTLTNRRGAIAADADFYELGLTDRRRDALAKAPGVDVRALGVQSFDLGADQLVVFAVNAWNRYSNAASNETGVVIDTNGDGNPEKIVFATDSGAVRTGTPNGLNEVFVHDVASGGLSAAGYLASSPTDSSTILLPVSASALGVTSTAPSFRYTAYSQSLVNDDAYDEFDGWAGYDPWKPGVPNGMYETVGRGKTVKVQLKVDANTKKGAMVVVFDNAAGSDEALLLTKLGRG